MLSYIANAENQVRHNLVLDLKIPVLHHARTPIGGQHRIDPILAEIEQRRVAGVAGRRVSWKTGVKRLYRRKVIAAGEVWIGRGATRQKCSEIGVAEGRIVDAVCAPYHRIPHKIR